MLAPLVVVLVLAALYSHLTQYPVATGALRGMGAVASGLVISTALKLLGTMKRNVMGFGVCLAFAAVTIAATAWLRVPLVAVILGLGSVAIAVAWTLLGRSAARA
jgi:chromate transporter